MDLTDFIKQAGIRPDKQKDQHFLIDSKILDYEAELLDLQEQDVVLEVGAGFGPLTIRLARKSRVLAVEIDPELAAFLRRIRNTVTMNNDVMKILEEARRDARTGAFNKIAGNIPYSRSQEILLELLRHPWSLGVLCVQKEFAAKLSDTREKLCLLMQDCCSAKIKAEVPADRFYPPAVDSSIILLKQKKRMDEELWKFLRRLFRSRNKNVSNVIRNAPARLAKKKVHELTLKEVRELMKAEKKQ
jgi:16S rRNA (adenine1518-N6/adenine1519-N6)-dimethyltransferase